ALPKSEIENINSNNNIKNEIYNINIYNSEKIFTDNLKNKKSLYGKINSGYVDNFSKYFKEELPEKDETALKNSVTSLSKSNYEQEYTSLNISPKTLKTSEHLSEKPTDIGITYHKVLEMISFNEINSLEEVENFLIKYFPKEKNILNSQKIFESVCCLKKFKYNSLLKEQKFMMYIPHNEIVGGGSQEKILIQGIVDLILLGEKNILIDYKYSLSINERALIDRYSLQLKIYKQAIESALNKTIDEVFILLINSGQLIEMN
ncbi:MAG: PD-(D/E)XK nuclease family protein, partial [Clostridia bacterium]|nr:PD-(D/E)XK nuclease family protein [Clostridia bacterium]